MTGGGEHPHMTAYDALVVGGGIVGASTGYHLARAGAETLLVDRADEGRATDAGAGILSPATSGRELPDAWYRFAFDAVAYYPRLVSRLEADGIDRERTGYARTGALRVAVAPEEVGRFERVRELIAERGERLGRPDPNAIDAIDGATARERFPALGSVERALYYADAARVDGRAFADALREAGRGYGLGVERASVESVRVEDGSVAGVRTADGERIDATTVVVAGGAWSGTFGEHLRTEIPIEPMRGQIAHLGLRDGDSITPDSEPSADAAESDGLDGPVSSSGPPTAEWSIVSAFRGHYLVPWPDGRVAAGATREAGSGFAPYPTAGGVREVLAEALRVAPGLEGAELSAVRVGLRPASADGFPVLGAVPDVTGAYLATGHGPTGLQLGPYSGKVVADLIAGEKAADAGIDAIPEAFSVDRFE